MPIENRSASNSFGAKIRKIRETARKSLSDLAAAMGVSVVYVSDIERGRRNPPLGEKLTKMAEFLNIDREEVETWALKERKKVELDLDARTSMVSDAALMLARRWDSISDDDASQILKILTHRGDYDR